jgi:hypothetical protein
MKKFFLVLCTILLITSAFSNVLDLVPSDSKALFYVKNLTETYESFKTVDSMKNFLLEPINAEIFISSLIEMYLRTIQVNPDTFFESLKTNMAIFMQEPYDNLYIFGVVFGPVKNTDMLYQALSRILLPIKEAGINFVPVFTEKKDGKYLTLVQDKLVYENSKLGGHSFEKVFDNGIYYKLLSAQIENIGYAYIKDKYLIGEALGTINPENVSSSYIKKAQDYDFLGTLFAVSSFLPKDLSMFNEIINIVANPDLVESILLNSKGFEVNADFNMIISPRGEIGFDESSYFVVDSEIKLTDLSSIFTENNLNHRYINDNSIIFELESPDELSSIGIGEKNTYYIWKQNSQVYLSSVNQIELNKTIDSSKKLSENSLFKTLNSRINMGDIAVVFIDLSKFYEQFVGIRGEFGFLFNMYDLGDGKTKSKFIMK